MIVICHILHKLAPTVASEQMAGHRWHFRAAIPLAMTEEDADRIFLPTEGTRQVVNKSPILQGKNKNKTIAVAKPDRHRDYPTGWIYVDTSHAESIHRRRSQTPSTS